MAGVTGHESRARRNERRPFQRESVGDIGFRPRLNKGLGR
jgi:hypothetical protein